MMAAIRRRWAVLLRYRNEVFPAACQAWLDRHWKV